MKPCAEFSLLLPAYAEGDLEGDERRRVEQHLKGCDACRRLAGDLAKVVNLLRALPDIPVRSGFTRDVVTRIEGVPVKTSVSRFGATVYRLAASVLLLCGAAAIVYLAVVSPKQPGSGTNDLARGEPEPATAPPAEGEASVLAGRGNLVLEKVAEEASDKAPTDASQRADDGAGERFDTDMPAVELRRLSEAAAKGQAGARRGGQALGEERAGSRPRVLERDELAAAARPRALRSAAPSDAPEVRKERQIGLSRGADASLAGGALETRGLALLTDSKQKGGGLKVEELEDVELAEVWQRGVPKDETLLLFPDTTEVRSELERMGVRLAPTQYLVGVSVAPPVLTRLNRLHASSDRDGGLAPVEGLKELTPVAGKKLEAPAATARRFRAPRFERGSVEKARAPVRPESGTEALGRFGTGAEGRTLVTILLVPAEVYDTWEARRALLGASQTSEPAEAAKQAEAPARDRDGGQSP